jgi:fucose permease
MGVGLAAGPVLAGQFALAGGWQGYPLALAGAAAVLAALGARAALPGDDAAAATSASGRHPARAGAFWLFAAIAVLYAFAEGTFANWAVIYLAESKQLSPMIAAYALSAFWAALACGRLAISALVLRVAPATIWRVLPAGMIAVFLALPHAESAAAGIGLFALAGLACSGFFPLTIGLTGSRFPAHVPWVASMLTGALMVGVGLGSWAVGLARQVLTLEQLYLYSAAYPAAVLVLAGVLGRRSRGT